MATSIEWVRGEDGAAGETWNFARGCSRVDTACQNCYAQNLAHRFSGKNQPYEGLTALGKHGPRWTGEVRFIPEQLSTPLKWRKPRRIFPCSMSDAFHADLTNEQIAAAFGVMAATPQHTYVMTTKRADRMREWFAWAEQRGKEYDLMRHGMPSALLACAWEACSGDAWGDVEPPSNWDMPTPNLFGSQWPLPNVHLGVSAGTQASADERIADLLETPAAVRWVSLEPLLESVGIEAFLKTPARDECLVILGGEPGPGLDWVVVGGESGPGARLCNVEWIRDVLRQCHNANVPCFVKQLGAFPASGDALATGEFRTTGDGRCQVRMAVPSLKLQDAKGGDMAEWPEDLRVRQLP